LHLRLTPGSYVLSVKPTDLAKTSTVTMYVKAAKAIFYRYEFSTGVLTNLMFIGSSIKLKDQAIAMEEMRNLSTMR
jgi:hypothetical protein